MQVKECFFLINVFLSEKVIMVNKNKLLLLTNQLFFIQTISVLY